MVDSKELQEWHNRGQTDAKNGVDNAPYSSLPEQLLDAITLGIFSPSSEDQEKIKKAYYDGQTNYEEQTDSSSCCYITSACLDDLGIPRTAREMTAMKTLTRDHILRTFGGKRDYIKYGRIAPGIVRGIRARNDSLSIWRSVYDTLQRIPPSVQRGAYQEGYDKYKSLVLGLEAEFAQ